VTIEYIETCDLPTQWGTFQMHGFEDSVSKKEHLALTLGDPAAVDAPLARVHSECLTGDALFSQRCDCGAQLSLALEKIANEGVGVLLYLRQEGRGIGLLNKVRAYHLQDQGADTVEANEKLGFEADMREYQMCKIMLAHLNVQKLRLMTNNPKKVEALEALAIEIIQRVPHKTAETEHNAHYLKTKAGKLGHVFK